MLVVPVLPAASRTVPVNVWVPFGTGVVPTGFVTHGIDTGPLRVDVVGLPSCWPSALSVKTLDVPLAPWTQIVTHTVPLTVAAAAGCVM